MEETAPEPQSKTIQATEKDLKHLDFVRAAAVYVVVCLSTLYGYAKENSGPLKPGVQTVEDSVQTVIGPVYEKFHDVPVYLLKFFDRKVDESMTELDHHVPALLKQVSSQALSASYMAPALARAVLTEVQRVGIVDAARNATRNAYIKYEPTAEALYKKYEPVTEQYAVSTWRCLNRLPLFPQMAHVLVPTAACWAEKYNQAVLYAVKRQYTASSYLPMVPIDRIAKVFKGANDEQAAPTSQTSVEAPK